MARSEKAAGPGARLKCAAATPEEQSARRTHGGTEAGTMFSVTGSMPCACISGYGQRT